MGNIFSYFFRLSKKNTDLNNKKKRLKEYQDERECFPHKFLSHMDANSALFSLEDAKDLHKHFLNTADKSQLKSPYCGTCVKPFEKKKNKSYRSFSNSSYDMKSDVDLSFEKLDNIEMSQSIFLNIFLLII